MSESLEPVPEQPLSPEVVQSLGMAAQAVDQAPTPPVHRVRPPRPHAVRSRREVTVTPREASKASTPAEGQQSELDDSSDFSEEQTEKAELSTSADLVRVYLREIGKVALLTAEDEVILSKRIEAGLLAEQIKVFRKATPDERTAFAQSLQTGILKRLEAEAKQTTKTSSGPKLSKAEREAAAKQAQAERTQRAATEAKASLAAIERLAANTRKYPDRTLRALIADGAQAKDHLLRANLRLVVSLAKRYTGHGMPFLDLIQEGNTGLIRAVEKFDYAKGFKFSTYATWWIRQGISRAMADQARTIRVPVHMVEHLNKLQRITREKVQELGRNPTPEELARELDTTPDKIIEMQGYGRDPISLDQTVGDDDDASLGDFIADERAGAEAEATVENALMHRQLQSVLGTLDKRSADVIRMRYGLGGSQPMTLDEIGQFFKLSRERIRQIERDAMAKLRQPSRSQVLRDYLDR